MLRLSCCLPGVYHTVIEHEEPRHTKQMMTSFPRAAYAHLTSRHCARAKITQAGILRLRAASQVYITQYGSTVCNIYIYIGMALVG